MPKASFTHSAQLQTPAAAVWPKLHQAATWAGIGPVDEVWDAVHDDSGELESFQWSAHVGPTKYKGRAEVAVAEAPHHMKLLLSSSELTGSLIADMEGGDEPLLAVTLEVASKGTMASLFFPIISEAIGRGLPIQVDEFAASLNTPSDPDPGTRPQPL